MPKKNSKIRNLASAVRSAYRGYRKVADPIKPAIDRVADPAALFLGTNTALATGIYHATPKANQALEYLMTKGIGPNAYSNVVSFLQDYPNVGASGKYAALAAIYVPANYYLGPHIKKMLKGESVLPEYIKNLSDKLPVGFHHARTWATIGAMSLVWHFGHMTDFAKRMGNKIGDVGSKVVDVVTDEELGKLLTGEKAHRIFADITDIFDIEPYRVPVPESREIETELNRAERRKPDILYTDRVSKDAAEISRKGIQISPEQLAYISRVVYFEGTFDKKASKDPQKILSGVHAITHVIKNRWEFEKQKDGTFGRRNKKDTLFDVAFHHGTKTRNDRTYTVWQFTCIRDHPKYFYEHRGKKGWDMYEGGDIKVAVGNMDPVRAQLAYEGVVDALSGKVPDPTGKSLFYQNPRFADKYNRNWDKKLDKVKEINSHVFYKFKEGSTQGPHASYIESPKSQKYGIPESQKPMLAYSRNNTLTRRRFQRMAG